MQALAENWIFSSCRRDRIKHNFKYPPTIRENKKSTCGDSQQNALGTWLLKTRTKQHQILFNVFFLLSFWLRSSQFLPFAKRLKCMLNYLHSSASCNIVLRSFFRRNVSAKFFRRWLLMQLFFCSTLYGLMKGEYKIFFIILITSRIDGDQTFLASQLGAFNLKPQTQKPQTLKVKLHNCLKFFTQQRVAFNQHLCYRAKTEMNWNTDWSFLEILLVSFESLLHKHMLMLDAYVCVYMKKRIISEWEENLLRLVNAGILWSWGSARLYKLITLLIFHCGLLYTQHRSIYVLRPTKRWNSIRHQHLKRV